MRGIGAMKRGAKAVVAPMAEVAKVAAKPIAASVNTAAKAASAVKGGLIAWKQ
jgi:hypothetical protein